MPVFENVFDVNFILFITAVQIHRFMMEIGTTFVPRGDLKMERLRFTEMGLSLAMELLPPEKRFQAEELGSWLKSKMRLGVVLTKVKRLRGS